MRRICACATGAGLAVRGVPSSLGQLLSTSRVPITVSVAVLRSIRHVTVVVALLCCSAVPTRAQSIQLFWDPPQGDTNVTYLIEGGTASGRYTSSWPVAARVTTFNVTGLTAGTRYYFVVRAVDAGGLRSGPSNEISAVAVAPVLPPAGAAEVPPTTTTPVPPPPPPPPVTTTLSVTSESALQEAVARVRSYTTLVLAPGTYQLVRPLVISGGVQDITIRSSTGHADDVVLVGPAPTATNPLPAGLIASRVTRLTLSGFTMRDVAGYPIVLGTDVQQPRLQGLRIVDNGQFVQSALHDAGGGAAGGIVEGCSFEYTGTASNLPTGIDIRGGREWILRGNRFLDAMPRERVQFGAAILAWQGSGGTLVERNVFIYTTREIVLGLDERYPNQHKGGVVRNNMIVRQAASGNRGAAISVLDSPGTIVVHNTALLSGTSSVAIDYAHPDTQNVYIANNLTDAAITGRDAATAIVDSNLTSATAAMFAAPAQGDLRLRKDTGRAAIDMGIFTPHAPTDAEGQPRPAGVANDIGADEVS